jgi:N-carbamoyl-L-amino-acid hydrolase
MLGQIGRDAEGKLIRLAASSAEKNARDHLVELFRQAELQVAVDQIGNIFGIWPADGQTANPVLLGSHIDTVIDAGIYDGSYGVLAGLEIIESLKAANFIPHRPVAVVAFTNEEGVRYMPDMMGSLVFAGGFSIEEALATVGTDGSILGEALKQIGYAGSPLPELGNPFAYIELHIEQGPVLEGAGITIGAVQNLQGISWQQITIEGVANHAGTTPMAMRRDAGYVAARINTFLHDWATGSETPTVATVGSIRFEPNAINVIPSRATFTVDLRDPGEERLKLIENDLSDFLKALEKTEQVAISTKRLARFEPVVFDRQIVELVEQAASKRGLSSIRMTSGAGHDAQMVARLCPAAMIFVPSHGGVSHSPREYTPAADLIAGANVLLDVVVKLCGREQEITF